MSFGRSLPVRGAWIEMVKRVVERVLLWVAPRKGSVDLNGLDYDPAIKGTCRSP